MIVQAADYRRMQQRIPDIAVWTRCFSLYVGMAEKYPTKLVDLLDYHHQGFPVV